MDKRETFSSRLGFVLISAGCAIGLGNVWRFPYITGKYGGAAFVLLYLLFLVILGCPSWLWSWPYVGPASGASPCPFSAWSRRGADGTGKATSALPGTIC